MEGFKYSDWGYVHMFGFFDQPSWTCAAWIQISLPHHVRKKMVSKIFCWLTNTSLTILSVCFKFLSWEYCEGYVMIRSPTIIINKDGWHLLTSCKNEPIIFWIQALPYCIWSMQCSDWSVVLGYWVPAQPSYLLTPF